MSAVIETSNLTKNYRNLTAVDHVSLHIEQGEIYGLIGRNGAGKTTVMKMIAGLLKPSEGEIRFSVNENRNVHLGALLDTPGIYPNMTARENLEIKRLCFGIRDERETERLLSMTGLDRYDRLKTKQFSFGMKQRLGIALAMMGDPEILLLDEPINGLDPQGIIEVRNMITEINQRRGTTVIISSHILEELSKTAHTFAILEKGRLISETTEEKLNETLPGHIVLVTDRIPETREVLNSLGFTSYQSKGVNTILIYEMLDRSDEIIRALVQAGVSVRECRVVHESLEDYFIGMTKEV